jgi:hypothetical protein
VTSDEVTRGRGGAYMEDNVCATLAPVLTFASPTAFGGTTCSYPILI